MCPNFFMTKWRFCRLRIRDGTSSQVFQKTINRFRQTRSQMKVHHFTFLYWEKNIYIFLIWIFYKKCIFFLTFFLISVFCHHMCSISTNEVSNEILWYPLSEKVKKINYVEIEKISKGSGGGSLCQKIFKVLSLTIFLWKKKRQKVQKAFSRGKPLPNFLKILGLWIFFCKHCENRTLL